MIRRRALLLCLQALIAAQLTFGASLAHPAPAVAAGPAASASAAASTNPAGGAAGAAAACALTSSTGGGLLSACAGAASYADFAAGLTAALSDLQADANTGSLTIRSDPAGATVALNGIEAGLTPLDVAVPPGVYLVRITKAGFVPFSHVVQVAAGVPTNVPAPLEALDGGNEGSFNWVRPNTMISLLGGNGFANGDVGITGYVRDKDGADYISFSNSKVVEIKFDQPTEVENINGWLKSDHTTVSTVGVARSSDDGLTWTLIQSWTGSFISREWTSARFDDAQWLSGKPGDLKSRWVRAYYHQRKIEEWSIWAMVPRPEGGVAVYATKITWDQPQELLKVWDGLGGGYNGTTYCREDDTDPLCYQRPNPGRYMTSLVAPYTGPSLVEAGSGPYKTVTSTSAISRYGMSQLDLATYNQVRTAATTVLNTRDGGETANDLAPLCCGVTCQGSYKDADYFLARDGGSGDVKGYIYVPARGRRRSWRPPTPWRPARPRALSGRRSSGSGRTGLSTSLITIAGGCTCWRRAFRSSWGVSPPPSGAGSWAPLPRHSTTSRRPSTAAATCRRHSGWGRWPPPRPPSATSRSTTSTSRARRSPTTPLRCSRRRIAPPATRPAPG